MDDPIEHLRAQPLFVAWIELDSGVACSPPLTAEDAEWIYRQKIQLESRVLRRGWGMIDDESTPQWVRDVLRIK